MYDKYRVKYLHPLPAFVFFPVPCSIMPTEDFIADTRMQFVLTFSACFFHSKYFEKNTELWLRLYYQTKIVVYVVELMQTVKRYVQDILFERSHLSID